MFTKRSLLLYTPYLLALAVLLFAAWTIWIAVLDPIPAGDSLLEAALIWFDHLSPVVIGLIFWLPGVLVLAFSRHVRRGVFFFIFCQAMCFTLVSGVLSDLGYPWGHVLFWASMVWTGPLTIHAVLALLVPTTPPRFTVLLRSAYALAAVLTVLYAAGKFFPLGPFSLYPVAIANLWLAANLGLVLAILIGAYALGETADTRRRAGILLLGNVVGFLPYLLFALLPDTLFDHPLLPYPVTFLFLAVIPTGYGYAILRFRLVSLQSTIDRGAAYSLIVMVVSGVYGICYLAFSRLLPNVTRLPLFVEVLLAVGLIFAVQPLYQVLRRTVNRFFYGAWYDDRAALRQISRSVGLASGDLSGVAYTLCRVLEKTIPLEYAHLMLTSGAVIGGERYEPLVQISEEEAAAVMDRLLAPTTQEIGRIQSLEAFAALAKDEQRRLLGPKPRLWMVLRGSESRLGLLVLGPARGGDFDKANLETLELLVRQARTALENASLLAQVRANAEQITRLHRQLLQVREAERKGLARDLHDQTIQSLYGVAYQLSELKKKAACVELQDEIDDLRLEITEILGGVRRICADLRPPSLDSLGVVPALSALVRKTRKATGLSIAFAVEGDEDQDVPEEVSLALYRILQEALANVHKHAGLASVRVTLCLDPAQATLIVADDGPGFTVPARLESLAQAGHYGLAGIHERVELAGGRLAVASAPGHGCRLTTVLPLSSVPDKGLVNTNYIA